MDLLLAFPKAGDMEENVLVARAGIDGLTGALALRAHGIDVTA